MTLATTTWVPGFEQHLAPQGSGGLYTDEGHPKLVWHTSESPRGSLDGVLAELAAKVHTDVYHIVVDPMLRRRAQVIPLNVAASALAHPPDAETNHDGAIQVCIIGNAHEMPNLSPGDLAWLGTAVLAPIAQCVPELHVDISATFYADTCGFTLATASNPPARQRMASAAWLAFNGQCGHQHVPGNDHWDPGGLNVHAITVAAHTVLNPNPSPTPSPSSGEEPMLVPSRQKPVNTFRGMNIDIGKNLVGITGDAVCLNNGAHVDPNAVVKSNPNPILGAYVTGAGAVTIVTTDHDEYHFDLP